MERITISGRAFTVLYPKLLRDLTAEERGRLKNSILQLDRVAVAVVVDENDGVIDGANRLRIASELGFTEVPVSVFAGLTAEQKEFLAKSLNKDRRQLSAEEVREEIKEELKASPEKSNRTIAAEVGASDKTVGTVRKEMERRAEIPHVETRKDTKGRQQPATKPPRPPKPQDQPILCDRCARTGAVADCPRCRDARTAAGIDAAGKKKAAPRKPTHRQELRDKVGNVLPDACRDAFADPALPGLIEELEQLESMFSPQSWVQRAGKLCDHYGFILITKFDEHAHDALHSVQLAIEALRAGVPHAVCPKCSAVNSRGNGVCCKACRGYGHVPEHRYAELMGADQ